MHLLDCTWTENKLYTNVQSRKEEPDFTSGAEVCIISIKAYHAERLSVLMIITSLSLDYDVAVSTNLLILLRLLSHLPLAPLVAFLLNYFEIVFRTLGNPLV